MSEEVTTEGVHFRCEMISQKRFNQSPKAETAESECKFMLNGLRTFARCKLLTKARVEDVFGSEKAFYGFSGDEIFYEKRMMSLNGKAMLAEQ